MRIKLDEGAYMPTRAHRADAGMDLRAKEAKTICPGGAMVFHTGVHVDIPEGCCGLIVSKSGLNIHHDITSTGLIDRGYTGEIVVKLHNHGTRPYEVAAGDKISQLVILPCVVEQLEVVDSFAGGERGDNGFGSSGR